MRPVVRIALVAAAVALTALAVPAARSSMSIDARAPEQVEPTGKLAFSGSIPYAGDDAEDELFVASPDGSDLRRLGPGTDPVWSPDGTRIAFIRNYRLFVANPDGSNVRRLTSVYVFGPPVWSPDGSTLAFQPLIERGGGIDLVSTSGGPTRTLVEGSCCFDVTWSPDSSLLAYTNQDDEIAIVDTSGELVRAIQIPANGQGVAWSPTGERMAFVTDEGLAVVGADGSGLTTIVASEENRFFEGLPAWSPNGRRIAFTINSEIAVADPDTGEVRQVTRSEAGEGARAPAWSPDGHWLVYVRERYELGPDDVWLVAADGSDRRPVTAPFPDGIDYSGSGLASSWADGNLEGGYAPRLPATVDVPAQAQTTLTRVGDLAADGLSVAVFTAGDVHYWNRKSGLSLDHSGECNFWVQELVVAGSTVAWVCANAWWDAENTLDVQTWLPSAERTASLPSAYLPAGTFLADDPQELNLHGDGSLLVYNTGRVRWAKQPAAVWRSAGARRTLILKGPESRPVVDVDRNRIAIRRGARVDVRGADGRLLSRVVVGKGGRVALSGPNLVLLRGQTLEVYDVGSGQRVRSWPLDPGGYAPPRLLDAEGDFAVYVAGIAIHLVRLSDGRDLALAIDGQADTGGADLEPDGLFYSYNEAYEKNPGRVAFVAFADLRKHFDAMESPTP